MTQKGHSMSGLNELNQRLSNIGMPMALSANNAAQLKQVARRDRVLNAVARVESHNDSGARTFLANAFQRAGILPNDPNQPAQAAAPAVAPSPAPEPTPAPTTAPMAPTAPVRQPPIAPRQVTPSQQSGIVNVAVRDRVQHHVYGGKAALTFELDETKRGVPTVALDGANAVAARQYDWSTKVRIQLTTNELPVVAATMLGMLPECSFSNHGPENNKGFAIEWQSARSSFFVKVWQGKGNLRAVPMTREDGFYVAQIVIRAIQQGSPARLDAAGLIATLRTLYGRA